MKTNKRDDWKDGIDGAKILFDPYTDPSGVFQPNWKIRCENPEHRNGQCEKRRGALPQFESRHGKIEPPAFLHCWRDIEWPSKPSVRSHPFEHVPNEVVDRYVEEHRAELEALLVTCGR